MNPRELSYAIVSIILCGWYMIAVTGFDIHTDSHDNRTYVVALMGGISCEDIHPEDECECCHEHGHEDCTDSIEVVTLTGTDHNPLFAFTALPVLEGIILTPVSGNFSRTLLIEAENASPPRTTLQKNCMLRV